MCVCVCADLCVRPREIPIGGISVVDGPGLEVDT